LAQAILAQVRNPLPLGPDHPPQVSVVAMTGAAGRAMALRRTPRAAAALRLLLGAVAVCVLGPLLLPAAGSQGAQQILATVPMEPPVLRHQPREMPSRRQSALLLSSAVAGGAAVANGEPAHAQLFGQDMTYKSEIFNVKGNPKTGVRPYVFEKPPGLRRLSNAIDPSGYLFRAPNDTYFTFVTRAEVRANASTDFSPNDFIADYESKFVNASGSSFTLIRGGPKPDRVDEQLGIKYYEVEYVVRTQLGFTFDSLRSLHFLTVFAAGPESIYIVNCQAQDERWDLDGPTLKRIASSFSVTG